MQELQVQGGNVTVVCTREIEGCMREIEGCMREREGCQRTTPSDWSEVAFIMAFCRRHSSFRDKWTSTVQVACVNGAGIRWMCMQLGSHVDVRAHQGGVANHLCVHMLSASPPTPIYTSCSSGGSHYISRTVASPSW